MEKLKQLHPKLQKAMPQIMVFFQLKYPELRLLFSCGYRSVKTQQKLYAQGRASPGPIVTYCDGIKKRSPHNYRPSRAVDVVVFDKRRGEVTWSSKHYEPLIPLCQELGLVCGGSWKKFKDWGHIELPDWKSTKWGTNEKG